MSGSDSLLRKWTELAANSVDFENDTWSSIAVIYARKTKLAKILTELIRL